MQFLSSFSFRYQQQILSRQNAKEKMKTMKTEIVVKVR